MEDGVSQFMKTVAWMFLRHGQPARARAICEALVEDDPRDGVSAVTLAELLLDDSDARRALEVLRTADIPESLEHVAAVLETRAMKELGRTAEASGRWRRYLESRKGTARKWV